MLSFLHMLSKSLIQFSVDEILKDNAAALNMPATLENSAVATGQEKVSFHSNAKERQSQRIFNYHTSVVISCASKVTLKILQARL